MSFRLKAQFLFVAALALFFREGVSTPAIADALIIQNPSDLSEETVAVVVRPSSRAAAPFGGRIVLSTHAHGFTNGVTYVRPRYQTIDPELLERVTSRSAETDEEPGEDIPRRETRTVVTLVVDDTCSTGAPSYLRAGDRFLAGGNMLRVPGPESVCGDQSSVRFHQRYLGFKRVYKGQAYTGFRRVYSGRKYLTGNY